MSEAPAEESREITVYEDFLAPSGIIKDLRPLPIRASGPKGESARESATSSMSPQSTVQHPSVTPVPDSVVTENPKNSTETELTTTTLIPEQGDSLLASSGQTNLGWNLPPAPVAPPTGETIQTP